VRIYKNGFSLVELVISLTIILLLTGIGVTTFSGLMRAKEVSTAKSELISWLSLSRNLAITGQLPDKSLGLKFVKVTFSSTDFTVDGVDNGTPAVTSRFFLKTFGNDLDIDDVTVTPNITSFGFNKGSGRLMDGSGNFINGPVEIVIKSKNVQDSIRINDLGVINEK
jgi:prepilin-type N-terminal cleavage/methylation domain-containing protein